MERLFFSPPVKFRMSLDCVLYSIHTLQESLN